MDKMMKGKQMMEKAKKMMAEARMMMGGKPEVKKMPFKKKK